MHVREASQRVSTDVDGLTSLSNRPDYRSAGVEALNNIRYGGGISHPRDWLALAQLVGTCHPFGTDHTNLLSASLDHCR